MKRSLHHATLWLVVLVWFAPVAWIILSAFKTRDGIVSTPPKLLFTPTLQDFRDLPLRGLRPAGNADQGAGTGRPEHGQVVRKELVDEVYAEPGNEAARRLSAGEPDARVLERWRGRGRALPVSGRGDGQEVLVAQRPEAAGAQGLGITAQGTVTLVEDLGGNW